MDYIDFLLLHNLQNMRGFETRFKNNGLFDWLLEQKAKGRIRHIGFSFHGTNDDLPGLVDLYDWDFVQIQLNYVDWKEMSRGWGGSSGTTSAEYLYKYLEGKGIPALVMEPVKGGLLADPPQAVRDILDEARPNDSYATAALRFAASAPGVVTTLSGMSTLEQVVDNCRAFEHFEPLSEAELAA
ncbi:aldo/keto reductase, partial [Vibrio sp. FNV 38]|nr:aldo/keto reductase [Vibrio sp. FNV 38]